MTTQATLPGFDMTPAADTQEKLWRATGILDCLLSGAYPSQERLEGVRKLVHEAATAASCSAPVSEAMSGRELRDQGIERVSAPTRAQEWLWGAREWAVSLASWHGSVTADDVRRVYPLWEGLHVNTWGALFRDPRFIAIGDAQTTHPAGHARRVRRWGLKR